MAALTELSPLYRISLVYVVPVYLSLKIPALFYLEYSVDWIVFTILMKDDN